MKEVAEIDSRENLIRLVKQYQDLIFSICLKFTGDYYASEDLTQETFLSAYLHWDDFDGASEKAWICRIASNKCIDYKRKAERKAIPTEDTEFPNSDLRAPVDPLFLYSNKETMAKFEELCRSLSPPYRKVSLAHYIGGLTAREISIRQGIPLKTVQTQIYRARSLLKNAMRKEDLE